MPSHVSFSLISSLCVQLVPLSVAASAETRGIPALAIAFIFTAALVYGLQRLIGGLATRGIAGPGGGSGAVGTSGGAGVVGSIHGSIAPTGPDAEYYPCFDDRCMLISSWLTV